jgi:putative glutamine amidotransferase
MLKIGLSACFFHPDAKRDLFKGKTLQYSEQSILHWVMSQEARGRPAAIAVMIPSPDGDTRRGKVSAADFARELDGLVLQGGADVCPASYDEAPLRPEWNGDRVRDLYEIDLMRAFMAADKPVLGICRGAQLINVAFGGTLFQDVRTQNPQALEHRNWALYDRHFHAMRVEPDSGLSRWFEPGIEYRVNSVHHQAVKDVGAGLAVEARSIPDGMVEAIRHTGKAWVLGLQWHPEFQDPADTGLIDNSPILREFLKQAATKK